MGFWESMILAENERQTVNASIASQYAAKLAEIFKMTQSEAQIQDTIKALNPKTSSSAFFSVSEICNQDYGNEILRILQSTEIPLNQNQQAVHHHQQLTLSGLLSFFSKFTLPLNKLEQALILKKVLLERDTGTIMSHYITSLCVVTVDRYILFFDGADLKDELQVMPNESMSINQVTVNIKKKEDKALELVETQPGYIYNSSKKIFVRFFDEDSLDQFNHAMSVNTSQKADDRNKNSIQARLYTEG